VGRSFGVGRFRIWCFEPVILTDRPERPTRLRFDLEEVFAGLPSLTTHESEERRILMERARKRYVGLDVHKDVVEYCILDATGKKIDGGRIVCEQSVLKRFAMKTLSSKDHVALEATMNTWSIVDILEPHVTKIVVGNPLKTKAIAEAKIKTDKIDAMILAQLLRCDFLPSVWIPDAKRESYEDYPPSENLLFKMPRRPRIGSREY